MLGSVAGWFLRGAIRLLLVALLLFGGGCGSGDSQQFAGSRDVLLTLRLRLDRIAREARQRKGSDGLEPDERELIEKIEQFGLARADLFLMAPPDALPYPVVVIDDPGGKLWNWLSQAPEAQSWVRANSDGDLIPQWEQIAQAGPVPDHLREVVVRRAAGRVVAGPPRQIAAFVSGKSDVSGVLAVQLADRLEQSASLVTAGLAVPDDPAALVEAWKTAGSRQPSGDGAAGEDTFSRVLEQALGGLAATEGIAVTFSFDGPNRLLSYLHLFDTPEHAARGRAAIGSREPPKDVPNPVRALLLAAFTDSFETAVGGDGRLAEVTVKWQAKADNRVHEVVGGLVMQLMQGGDGGGGENGGPRASEGPIETVYTDPPQFVTDLDLRQAEAGLQAGLSRALFAKGRSGDDNVWFDVDPVPVPNGSLAKASYQVTAATSQDGHNILGADHPANHLMIEGGLLRQPFLVVPIAANVADTELGSATVRFRFELPTRLTVFELTAADRDRPKEQDGIRVTLQRLERDVFAGKIQGGPERGATADDTQLRVHLFALDQAGRGLAFQQYSSTMFGFSGQFQGVVDKAGVVIEQEVREIVVDVEVDLHGGQPVSIPGEPSDDVPVRYRVEEPAQYLSTDPAALQGRTVEWLEPLREVWSHRLQLGLPETAGDVSSIWELNWFGRDKPLFLDGRESWTGPTGQRASSICQWKPSDQERGLTPAHAVVGALRIVIPTNIRTLAFEKRAEGEWIEQPVPGGGPLRVRFDKQIVTAALGTGRALDFRAYDAAGRSLKAGRTDPRASDDAQWYFWGQPARVELVVSFELIDQTIPFEIVHRELDEAAYEQFKQTLNDEREVIRALQQIQQQMYRAYRPGDYDTIADFHFLHDRDGQPQRAVPDAVAHACPDAQARYGYQLTPYHGYYFGLITEFEQGGSRQPYGRSPTAVEQTWDGGRVAILGFTDRPVPAAWPVNPRQPSFLTVYRAVHAKLLDGARPDVFPEDPAPAGWVYKPTIDGPPK